MTREIPYHVGTNDRFSLSFVNPERDEFRDHLEREALKTGVSVKARQFEFDRDRDDRTLYAVYTHSTPDSVFEERTREDVKRILDEQFSEADLHVLAVVTDLLYSVARTVEDEGGRFQAYKDMHLEAIPDVLDYPEWGEATIPEVAGQLLSRFILEHPMPNANHRTAIGLTEAYLQAHREQLTVPDTGKRGTWYEWARPFIHESKRLLTVRRKMHVLRYAREFGVRAVRRKNDVVIDLSEYDLERDDPWTYYGALHEDRSVAFVRTILAEIDADDLEGKPDPGRDEFIRQLEKD